MALSACSGVNDNASPVERKTIEATSDTIHAAAGGTINLPSGSGIVIPPGALTSDQVISLSLTSSLPAQPPGGIVVGTGSVLTLSFKQTGGTLDKSTSRSSGQRDSSSIQLILNSVGVKGVVPFADVVDLTGGDNFVGLANCNTDNSATTCSVSPSALQNAKEFNLSNGIVKPRPAAGVPPPPIPGAKIWNTSSSSFVDGTSGLDPNKKTLVLVHGMLSSVEGAFGELCICPDGKNALDKIMKAGGYEQVVGFDYNWTQSLGQSGKELAAFLNQLKVSGITSVDIEAHSEGVPVSLSAAAQTGMEIGNMSLLGGPIMGTPAASTGAVGQIFTPTDPVYDALMTTYLNYRSQDVGEAVLSIPMLQGSGNVTLQDLKNGACASELQPGSDSLKKIRDAVISKMAQPGSNLYKTKLILAGGSDYSKSTGTSVLGGILKSTGNFSNEFFDGIVGVASAYGVGAGFDNSKVTKLGPYPVGHTQLECDSNVIKDVGKQVNDSPSTGSICSYSYSAWSSCQPNSIQTRSLLSSSPPGCSGSPVLSQACGASTVAISTAGCIKQSASTWQITASGSTSGPVGSKLMVTDAQAPTGSGTTSCPSWASCTRDIGNPANTLWSYSVVATCPGCEGGPYQITATVVAPASQGGGSSMDTKSGSCPL